MSGEESRALRSKCLPFCFCFHIVFRVGFSLINRATLLFLRILSDLSFPIRELCFSLPFPSLSPATNYNVYSKSEEDGLCRVSGSGGRPERSL